MMVNRKSFARLIEAKDTINLMGRSSKREGPETIRGASASDDDSVTLHYFDLIFGKDSDAVVVTELREGDESTSTEII
jgi:hypothetical protein